MCDRGKVLLKLGMSNPGPAAWTWQPGKMTDHDDFKYAGNPQIADNLQEKKVSSISLDSAHFYSKWPLFFLSAEKSSMDDDKIFFKNAIDGLIANLFKNVVTKNEGECVVRFNNYIDGTNGVFRWNYNNNGTSTGHSEYALSYTPFFSSLALLDNQEISSLYKNIASYYPYSTEKRKKYFWSRGLEDERLLIMLSEKQPSNIVKGEKPSLIEQNYYTRYFAKRVNATQDITTQDAYAAVVGDRMLVMHYAFFTGYEPWMNDFYAYADKASQLICAQCVNSFDRLSLAFLL
jgi:hypothetical protein